MKNVIRRKPKMALTGTVVSSAGVAVARTSSRKRSPLGAVRKKGK